MAPKQEPALDLGKLAQGLILAAILGGFGWISSSIQGLSTEVSQLKTYKAVTEQHLEALREGANKLQLTLRDTEIRAAANSARSIQNVERITVLEAEVKVQARVTNDILLRLARTNKVNSSLGLTMEATYGN